MDQWLPRDGDIVAVERGSKEFQQQGISLE